MEFIKKKKKKQQKKELSSMAMVSWPQPWREETHDQPWVSSMAMETHNSHKFLIQPD
jgi:hypothetical protein